MEVSSQRSATDRLREDIMDGSSILQPLMNIKVGLRIHKSHQTLLSATFLPQNGSCSPSLKVKALPVHAVSSTSKRH